MTVTYEAVVAILGFIVLVGGAIGVISKAVNKVLQPYRDIGDKMDRDKRRLDQHDNDLEEIKQQIAEDRKVHKLQNKALLNMMNHMIDGNNVADMKKTRDEIIDFMSED